MEKLKQDIYDYVIKHNLTDEEIKHIDNYVAMILERMEKIHKAQENILNDSKEMERFKNLLLEKIDLGE